MKISVLVLNAFLLLAVIGSPARADETLGRDLLDSLAGMRAVYRAEYAPAAWKKAYASYDLDAEYAKAVAAVQATPNLDQRQAREILKSFIYAMKDYHTSIAFLSTEQATLPLVVKGTQDHYYLLYIDRSKLSEETFPFHVGDEVVKFDGQPTADAVAAVQAEIPANVPSTDKALAEVYLTNRRAARGYRVPQGPVTLSIKAKGSDSATDVQLIWEYTPEKIAPRGTLRAVGGDASRSSLLHPRMSVDLSLGKQLDSPYALGGRKSFTPALGTKVWESADSDFFHAYIYQGADRRLIGYVRIASYEAPDFERAVDSFGKVIGLFEATTDAMVIDEVNNPGGSVFYLYALASMLTDHPLSTPRHRMSITQADVAEALKAIPTLEAIKNDDDARKNIQPDELGGYTPSYEFAQFYLNYARFIVSEWNAGHKLSSPYWIAGVDHINPAPVHYTKPILLVVNSLDFSGGDFFPAIMQDNKRVTVFGTRTAGAGGYVNNVNVPNNLGIDYFRVTESIAERADRNPIENLGISPDVAYTLTEKDYSGNYADYVAAIRSSVDQLLAPKKP